MADALRTCAKERFREFLSRKNLRLTAQREAIMQSVFATQEHFTADELLKWSRRIDRTVSRATVYRTLPLLTESGLVREMDFGKDHKYYDPNYAARPHHNHIICEDCDRIVEFDSDEIDRFGAEVSRRLGFIATAHRLQITGRCEELRRTGSCHYQPR
jgi:Fur family ferric uptake transcriptional regulator